MRDQILMSIFCLVVVFASLVSAGWLLISGALGAEGIDALFEIAVCLLMAAAFSYIPIQSYREGLFHGLLHRRHGAHEPPAANPGPAEQSKAQEGSSGG